MLRFSRRKTVQWVQGDIAYLIMGLLRSLPRLIEFDSAFQAFARLSLADESKCLLERLLCIRPPETRSRWYITGDSWGTAVGQIEQNCQIIDNLDGDAMKLGEAYCATIFWTCLDPAESVPASTRDLVHPEALPAATISGIVIIIFAIAIQ